MTNLIIDNVIVIGDFGLEITRRYEKLTKDTCDHLQVELDDTGEIVTCKKCKIQVSAYWALRELARNWKRANENLEARRKKLEEDKEKAVILLAAQKVEKAWRKRDFVPTCPHCKRGIFPKDGFGDLSIHKQFELKRREPNI